ncbi:MAG: hypothetical protein ACOH5I_07720 [Oligoflexus sp.]
MLLKLLVYVWLLLTALLFWEYAQLNQLIKGPMILQSTFCGKLQWCKTLKPDAGHMLSYVLGWLGFGLMCLTNIYVMRKRWPSLAKYGKLQTYLDWHIFFGLLGPTLILFHCNFKVRGLVAISFWSMVISFASGIIGRYFYLQLLQAKTHLRSTVDHYEKAFDKFLKISRGSIQKRHMDMAKAHAFSMALGGVGASQLQQTSLASFLYRSIRGDMHLFLSLPPTPWPGNRFIRKKLREWARLRRRLIFINYYKVMFGYWRTFHTPFAIFMYIVAVIHIISSLIFKVH